VSESRVFRRHLFFLSGFDPKGAAHYHRLYATEAERQGNMTGVRYEVGPRHRTVSGNSSWQVASVENGTTTARTTFEHVRWDDIVRTRWPRSAWDAVRAAFRAYRAVLQSPAGLRKTWRASPRTLVSLAYPIVIWLSAAIVVIAAACLAFAVGKVLAGEAAAAGIGIGVAAAAGWAALRLERRFNTTWLLSIYDFCAGWCEGRMPELPGRLDSLANEVERALRDPEIDEVLIVGFSVGSALAVSTAARVHARCDEPRALEKLAILTLAHCIPLLGLLRNATDFRRELLQVAKCAGLRWVDYSSPADWGSFALVDPVALCLGEVSDYHRPVLMLSPRFHTMFEPRRYAKLVRDKRRMHLQYLMAGERPARYDYFRLTAGPEALPATADD
jgi:hypothetical protein